MAGFPWRHLHLLAAKNMAAQGPARQLMIETQTRIEKSQPLAEDVTDTLDQISEMARSVRLPAEMLEQQPEAIFRGKGQ
jgi:hypothetical protein